ncbi:MAG: peptidoglycan editing factor PgeF [Phenylobacterium sp.]|uniref:peptidoglycan editing factor PgeF n=1 Tax=Phenylobacterium sp. TaxID=1871053 RepID=UPI00391CA808
MSELPVLTSPLLDLPGVRHAFFTRQGGVSQGIYASLNIGRGSGDAPDDVAENRRRAAARFGVGPEALLTCYQVHSPDVQIVEAPWDKPPEADGVATRRTGLICGALAADCAPILLADPQARVVAAAHAGWKGALTGVAEAAVARMVELGAEPARMTAVIGPCIGPASYEVGLEFLDRFVAADAGAERFFAPGAAPDKRQFDLPAFVLSRLNAAGVANAAWIGRDTCAEDSLFYSNRRAFKRGEPDYGRLLSAIMLV